MVDAISPAVSGGRRVRGTALLHVLGSTVGSALTGAAFAWVGGFAGAAHVTAAVVGAASALYLLRDAFGLPIPVPAGTRQVPQWWGAFFSPGTAAALYGGVLGTGFATPLMYSTLIPVGAAAFLSADPALGALLFGTFGAVRAGVVLTARVDGVEGQARRGWPRAANAAVLAALAVVALLGP